MTQIQIPYEKEIQNQSDTTAQQTYQVQKIKLSTRLQNFMQKFTKFTSNTSGVDRCIRLTAYVLRTIKTFQMMNPDILKKIDKLNPHFSSVRLIIRRNRKWAIIFELINRIADFKKNGVTLKKILQFLFRVFILITQINDYIQYIYYIGLINNQQTYLQCKKWNLNFYFFECLCWFVHYWSDYNHTCPTNKEKRLELKIYLAKYVLDIIMSHNDFSFGKIKLDAKIINVIGVISSLMAIYNSWK